MTMRKIKTGALLALVAVTLAASASVAAQQTQQAGGTAAAENNQDMQAITREMQALKSRYADEVRKLRELEIRLQALTARVQAQEGVARVQAIQQGGKPAATTGVAGVGVAAGRHRQQPRPAAVKRWSAARAARARSPHRAASRMYCSSSMCCSTSH
jgi:hypothetical protein